MKSISEVPADVITQIAAAPEEFWQQVSNYLYGQLLAGVDDHRLVRIGQRFDFATLVARCQDYRHYAGERGQEATYSVEQLCRALFIRHLNQWSFRKTCDEIGSNLLLRWFVGFLVNEQILSYVTLQRFEEWLLVHDPHLFHNEFLAQISQDFPEDLTQPQAGDTFSLLARSTPQSRTQLLRSAGRKVIFYLQQLAPPSAADLLQTPLPVALFGLPTAPREHWLNKEQRNQLELDTAQAADDLLRYVHAHLPQPAHPRCLQMLALTRWLGILGKLLSDEFVIIRDDVGAASVVRHCSKEERGSFVLGSTVDTDATFRNHGKKSELGYNVQVAATDKFVYEIFATTGATSDSAGVAALVANQLANSGHVPPKLVYDRAAGSPKLFHDVAKASGGQTQLVAQLIDHSKPGAGFGPAHFTLNEDGSLTCPNGQISHTFYRAQSGDGWQYRFSAQQCQECPLWQFCRTDKPAAQVESVSTESVNTEPAKPASTKRRKATPTQSDAAASASLDDPAKPKKRKDNHRSVFISDYRDWQRRAILYTATPEFKDDMAFRSSIERTIACLVRYNGARHASSYGLAKADFQVRMAALSFNLKRWHLLTQAKEHPRRAKQPPDTS